MPTPSWLSPITIPEVMVTVEVASANPFPLSAPLKLLRHLRTIQSLAPVMIYVNNTYTVNINSYSFWTPTASIVSPFYIFPHRSNQVWFLNIITIDVNLISILDLPSTGPPFPSHSVPELVQPPLRLLQVQT
jgi:hypothetical protein